MPRTVGRPRGSTDGRLPPGGYPPVTPETGAFLAGFIEGEACFSIAKQPRNTNHRCSMHAAARDDDRQLIHGFADATRVGAVLPTKARATSKPQVVWQVRAKSDCRRLIEILDAYPLRGRKSHDYAIWRSAVLWWIGNDVTSRVKGRDWGAMIYLKRRLTAVKEYPGSSARIEDADLRNQDWIGFLSGYLSAEGHLGISKNSNGFMPRAQITVRADDEPLLAALQSLTDAGTLTTWSRGAGSSTRFATWAVRRATDLLKIAEILDQSPPRGRKGREYAIWRQAVDEYGRPELRHKKRRRIHARLAELREALLEARAYSPPAGADEIPSQ